MIDFQLQKLGIEMSVEKLICDFEIGIQKAALSVFDTLTLLGRFFNFGQCVWKRAQQEAWYRYAIQISSPRSSLDSAFLSQWSNLMKCKTLLMNLEERILEMKNSIS